MLETIKHTVDYLSAPTISFSILTVVTPILFPPTDWFDNLNRKLGFYLLWTKKGCAVAMAVITAFFAIGYMDENFSVILMKGDNFPIVLMVYSIFFFTWLGMHKAYINDERIEQGLKPSEYNDPDDKVLVWPDLVYIEFIALILFTVFLVVWSILVAAPLEEPANPAATPNPSKAPWYFLGLQEMLVYYDPWIAGILLPLFCILGLMAIPYMDINKKGDGYYSFKERRVGIFIFMYGWIVLWLFLIVLGTFFRGPNWNFYGPFEYWDAHKVVALNNVNLSEYFWVKLLGTGLPDNILLREVVGFIMVGIYLFILPIILAKTWLKDMLEAYGPIRFVSLMVFGLVMLSLPLKMYFRWIFNLKYFIAIPEFFFNI
ncbi:MAG: cytochrome C [bacterium TMED46]|nr:MAG: cytochrome C [bacterium TMED46]|tara:strand:- start:1890 stop:3008 length:1119 start_codon:yes stop_codon:yes gene_type:complete